MATDQHTGSTSDRQDGLPDGALPELTDGLILLWRAHNYAQAARADVWDFAIEIQQFYDLGLTINELRWLVGMGFAQHRRETTANGDARRSFQPEDVLVLLCHTGRAQGQWHTADQHAPPWLPPTVRSPNPCERCPAILSER